MGDINVQLHEARQRRIVSLYLLFLSVCGI